VTLPPEMLTVTRDDQLYGDAMVQCIVSYLALRFVGYLSHGVCWKVHV
jgi:hypothetical protein